MRKILLTGKNGQVGWELQRTLSPLGRVLAYDRQILDLQDPHAISQLIRKLKPDVIVNAAAYTAVDQAESDQAAAHAINSIAPGVMAEEAKKCGALFVHYSTDYVFNGSNTHPYQEDDVPAPLNWYGKTKWEGERAIQQVSGKHLILRTSWVYGARGKNFLLTMLRLGKERDLLKIVDDQIGAPTWSRSIAEATAQMVSQSLSPLNQPKMWGTYHMTAEGHTSWFGFAKEIFHLYEKAHKGAKSPQLQPIETREYPTPAKRPHYSLLSNQKLKNQFQLGIPHWKEDLHLCMEPLHFH